LEYFLLFFSALLLIIGLLGSVLPVLPGPPISWLGLLLLYLTSAVTFNPMMVWGTLALAVIITIFDYFIPAQGTKWFGGSSYGIWGTNIGLFIGFFSPIPLGFIIGPFIGAFIGEMLYDAKNVNRAFKAAFGAFVGFLASTFLKVVVCLFFIGVYVMEVIAHFITS
jgi:uncharacterized protein YqgC (DUF456 family)